MADSQLDVTIRGRDELTPQLNQIESRLIRFVGFISSALATAKLGAFPITSAASFQRELANVTKTTGFTENQIDNLGKSLGELSLRTDNSADDLAKIAAAAGQQGLGREGVDGILAFTDSVARMASVLDLTAESAATSIGKILNIFQIPLKQVEKVSSAINQVSNNSTARATELLNVLRRLGDAGGSLKFTQSLALSATAIDLGATPEVAGTTLSKFISALKVRNAEFADLLGRTKEQLAQDTQTDAFQVFVDTAIKFNDIKLVDRQKALTKLFGGGRITALGDKFLQDVLKNNSILQKNLNQANSGYDSETSAKKEQATVLATLTKQVDILKNSFSELNRSAGQDLLIPLAGYVAQLRIALQNPAVKSFVEAVVKSLGELVEMIVSTTKFLSGLNVNWENFIKVLKVFALMKLGEIFLGIVSKLPGMGVLLGTVAKQTTATGTAATGAGKAGVAAAQQQITALGQLKLAIAAVTKAYMDGLTKQETIAAKQSALAAKEVAERAAIQRAALLDTAAKTATRQSKIENSALAAATTDLSNVKKSGDANIQLAASTGKAVVDNASAIGQAKREAAARVHEERVAAIKAEFAGKRTAIDKANRDALLAAEQSSYARQLASLKTQDAKRIAEAQKFSTLMVGMAAKRAADEIAIEEAKVAKQQSIADKYAARKKAADAAAVAATSAAAAATTTVVAAGGASNAPARAGAVPAAAAAAPTLGGILSRAGVAVVGAASTAMTIFSRVLTTVGTVARFAFAAIGPLYLAFVVLSSILDHFGILDKLPDMFRKLTDAMGFTSEATRKLAQAEKDAQAIREQEKKDLDDLLERYNKLKDVKTGLISLESIDKVGNNLKGATSDNDVNTGLQDLSLLLAGSEAEAKRAQEALKSVPIAYTKAVADTNKLAAELKQAQAKLAAVKAADIGSPGFSVDGIVDQTGDLAGALEEQVRVIQEKYDAAAAVMKNVGPDVQKSLASATPLVKEKADQIRTIVSGMFTPESARLFDQFYAQVEAAKKALLDLESTKEADIANKTKPQLAKLAKAQNDVATSTTADARRQATERLKLVEDEIQGQKAIVIATIEAIRKQLASLNNDKSVSGAVKASINNLMVLFNRDLGDLKTLKTAKDDLTKAGIPFTGALVNPTQLTPPKPTRNFEVGGGSSGRNSGESEARKLIKARAELAKAELAAEAVVQKQKNDSFLQEDQRMYDKGLLAIEDYFDDKDAIERSNLAMEIRLKQDQIRVKQDERKEKGLKESDRVKIDAEVVALNAEKDVLIQRIRDIPAQTQDAIEKAIKDFNENVLQSKMDVARAMGLDSVDESVSTQLDLISSEISIKLAKFRAQLAAGTPGITAAFIQRFEVTALLKTVDPVLQLIAQKAITTSNIVQNAVAKITTLRERGAITDREAERATNDARATEAAAVKEEIEQSEQALEAIVRRTAAETGMSEAMIRSSDQFRQQETAIDSLKQKYEELKVAVDEVALSVNQSVESGLSKGISAIMSGTTGGLRNLLKTFTNDLTSTLNQIVSKDLAQTFIKDYLGGGGQGGIGAYFSKLLNPKGVGGAEASKELVNKDLLGRSEATAMFVKVVGKDGKPVEEGKKDDPFREAAEKAAARNDDSLASVFDKAPSILPDLPGELPDIADLTAADFSDFGIDTESLASTVDDTFSTLSDGIVGGLDDIAAGVDGGGLGLDTLFDSLSGALGSVFEGLGAASGNLASTLSSLIGSLFGGGGGASTGNALASIVGSFFHTGGVVGEGAVTRHVSPMVFAGAVRYHTGGIAGLQPDEVPSILRKGEEVLTENNPRHRNNGGGQAPNVNINMTVNTPDANSFRKSRDQIMSDAGAEANRVLRRNK